MQKGCSEQNLPCIEYNHMHALHAFLAGCGLQKASLPNGEQVGSQETPRFRA